MGLGKTRQAIVAMQIAAPNGMILVVCPASLKLNWRREIRMVDPDAKIEVLGVADGEQADPRWVIVNYDLLAKNAERLHGIPWSGVILDEAHFIKNNSQRTSHCLKLLGVSNDARAASDRSTTGLSPYRHADHQPAQDSSTCCAASDIRPRGVSSPSPSNTATLTRTTMAGLQPEHRTSKS